MSIKDMAISMAADGNYGWISRSSNSVKTFVSSADSYVSTAARLQNINDGLQTQAELIVNKVYKAAQRSRTGYVDLANSTKNLIPLAADAFSGNDEAIRFGELMGKAFKVSGALPKNAVGMYFS
ncbi:hypothetical protein KHA80_02970 [Anaerobacillus sp. HL2]|nr:hypothetical protein KHA80_02970 [Anaerobacillus sp. HL2]